MNLERLDIGRILLMVAGVASAIVITSWMLSVMPGAVVGAIALGFLLGLVVNVALISFFNPIARILDLKGWQLAKWIIIPPLAGVLIQLTTWLPGLGS